MTSQSIHDLTSDDSSESPVNQILSQRTSRRSIIKRAAGLGLSVPFVTSLLAACGGDDDDAPATATTSAATATTAPSGGTAAPATAAATATRPAGSTSGQSVSTSGPSTPAATAEAQIPTGGTVTFAITREPNRLDASQTTVANDQIIHFSIHDCLVGRDSENLYHAWLANSWEISDDGLEYTFELRDDVTFHDGTPFNSEAVQFLMDRVHDPDAPFVMSGLAYGFYDSTETPDEYTAVIKLSQPWAPLMDALSYLYRIVSPTTGREMGWDMATNPVGTGPFKFVEWVPGTHVTLEKNPDYNWASTMFQHQGPAYIDELIFRQIPENSSRVAALENDEVQIIEVLPPQDAERLKDDDDYRIVVGRVPGRPWGYSVNMRKPPTAELEVRQAMNWAINQDAIVQTVYGPFQSLGAYGPAYTCMVPITWGYEPKAAEIYDYDPEKAIELLEGNGWMPGDDGIRVKDGQRLEILLSTWVLEVEEIIQAQFREVGIDLQIQLGTVAAANDAARNEQVHMSPLPSPRSDPNYLNSNHSRNRPNGFEFTYHTNDHFDELIDAGAAATNDDERLEIYSELQMIIMQDGMYLPVYNRDNVSAARSTVKGEIILDRGYFPMLYDIYIEE